jgi:hypothetical protein
MFGDTVAQLNDVDVVVERLFLLKRCFFPFQLNCRSRQLVNVSLCDRHFAADAEGAARYF